MIVMAIGLIPVYKIPYPNLKKISVRGSFNQTNEQQTFTPEI